MPPSGCHPWQTLSGLGFTPYNPHEQSAETHDCFQCGNRDTFLPKLKGSVICQYQAYVDHGNSTSRHNIWDVLRKLNDFLLHSFLPIFNIYFPFFSTIFWCNCQSHILVVLLGIVFLKLQSYKTVKVTFLWYQKGAMSRHRGKANEEEK